MISGERRPDETATIPDAGQAVAVPEVAEREAAPMAEPAPAAASAARVQAAEVAASPGQEALAAPPDSVRAPVWRAAPTSALPGKERPEERAAAPQALVTEVAGLARPASAAKEPAAVATPQPEPGRERAEVGAREREAGLPPRAPVQAASAAPTQGRSRHSRQAPNCSAPASGMPVRLRGQVEEPTAGPASAAQTPSRRETEAYRPSASPAGARTGSPPAAPGAAATRKEPGGPTAAWSWSAGAKAAPRRAGPPPVHV